MSVVEINQLNIIKSLKQNSKDLVSSIQSTDGANLDEINYKNEIENDNLNQNIDDELNVKNVNLNQNIDDELNVENVNLNQNIEIFDV